MHVFRAPEPLCSENRAEVIARTPPLPWKSPQGADRRRGRQSRKPQIALGDRSRNLST